MRAVPDPIICGCGLGFRYMVIEGEGGLRTCNFATRNKKLDCIYPPGVFFTKYFACVHACQI